MTIFRCRAPVALVFALLGAQTLQAQDEYFRTVRAELARNLSAAHMLGLGLSHEPWTGTLHQNRYRDNELTLYGGYRYAITAACDQDCSDIDLVLFDSYGDKIDSDTESDDRPVIVVQPRTTETFQIRAIMVECASEPCAYGLGVFSNQSE